MLYKRSWMENKLFSLKTFLQTRWRKMFDYEHEKDFDEGSREFYRGRCDTKCFSWILMIKINFAAIENCDCILKCSESLLILKKFFIFLSANKEVSAQCCALQA